ncbi:hypothetical protein EVAR_66681_1 [Eumeta japonica]|uniref:Uncharacterized protein n=1 Tax=Eumeta variegata TaxID=151549 RepID=A0A4C1ZH92_EUMVA|nr:hypothetical protein EVAR_66681_1 [Eumeta japonica]
MITTPPERRTGNHGNRETKKARKAYISLFSRHSKSSETLGTVLQTEKKRESALLSSSMKKESNEKSDYIVPTAILHAKMTVAANGAACNIHQSCDSGK